MPMPTTERRRVTRYRRPIWLPGRPARIDREIPIATGRWFRRDLKPGNMIAWSFVGFSPEPFGFIVAVGCEGTAAQQFARAIADRRQCLRGCPAGRTFRIPFAGGSVVLPVRIAHALRAKLGRIARLRKLEACATAALGSSAEGTSP